MAPGDLIDHPYQYEFRGWLFGSGTSFQTTSVDHMDLPAVVSSDTDLQGDHGTNPGVATYGSKIMSWEMNALGVAGGDIEGKLAVVRKALQLPRRRYSRVLDPLVYMRPGEPKKYVDARCINRHIPSDYDTARGKSVITFQLQAFKPIWKSLSLDSRSVDLVAGVTSASTTIQNLGDFEDGYQPVITITGPWTNPRIQNIADDSRTLRLDIVLTAVDELVVDMSGPTIYLNGVRQPWTNIVRTDNQWWVVIPGDNELVIERDPANTAATGTFKIEWRHTWV